MNIIIWGAGGIGCYYGARLQNAGAQVTFIAKGEHLKALQENGLRVTHPNFNFNQPVTALDENTWLNGGLLNQPNQLLQGYSVKSDSVKSDHSQIDSAKTNNNIDLVILCFKSNATKESLIRARDWLLRSNCYLLSLQNGVDNEADIANIVGPERTLGGLAVRIGAQITEPGAITATGIAQVVFGPWPKTSVLSNEYKNAENKRAIYKNIHKTSHKTSHKKTLNEILALFKVAHIDCRLSENIQHDLWKKLLINAAVNPISALTELDTKTLTHDPILGPTIYSIMQETAIAAQADDVLISEQDVNDMFELISTFDAIKTSMLIDLEHNRPLELDAICGAVIERCNSLNQPAKTMALIYRLLTVKLNFRNSD